MKTTAVMIAGAGSGSGKTTLTLGLMAALKQRGLNVQGFKAGPDYIDPSLHHIITGNPSINLDAWMMSDGFLRRSFTSRMADKDIAVIEGVMGIHDGRAPDSPTGSTAALATKLNVPTILVIPAASMARTAAAVVNGLVAFDPMVRIIGVVFNLVGSLKHRAILEKAMATYGTVPMLGAIPRDRAVDIPSRHLGLHMGQDGVLDTEKIRKLARLVSTHVDIDTMLSRAETNVTVQPAPFSSPCGSSGRIAVARDNAFCFYYEDNFEVLRQLGYDIVFFSPLKDTVLPRNISLYYFGGGYPELYAAALSENEPMRRAVLEESRRGAFIYGECGGLMYLGHSLTTLEEKTYPMCQCFSYHTVMKEKLRSLGYTEVRLRKEFLFLKQDTPLRGHCFHYSEMIADGKDRMENTYTGDPVDKARGVRVKNTLASYVHLHFSSLVAGGKGVFLT